MKKIFATRIAPTPVDASLLILRLIVGAAFMIHGWGKMQAPMAWMGPDSPVPGAIQFLGAFSEFGGGLALIIGLLCRLGSLGIVFTMIGATATHMFILKDPFVNSNHGGSYELASVYFAIALFFVLNGPGKFSLDAKIFGTRS